MDQAEIDRRLAELRDGIPRLWWAYYTGCLAVGFNTEQAMSLVQTYVTAMTAKVYLIQPPPGETPT
jgi:hypothetical protein